MTRTLAIDGGAPLRSTPMPTWPAPGETEVAAVSAVVASGRLNYHAGTEGASLEAEYAAALDRRHAVAVANGTLALELALRAFEIGPGDDVVVPARTFIATASAVVAVGATPVVADIDPVSNNMTAFTLAQAMTERTRAVIPVHVGGWPVDMPDLMRVAAERDLIVIEDCAQAHGGSFGGRPLGSFGHAAAFSFCQDKIISAGEGGLLVLDDDAAFERAWAYKDHGKSLAKLSDPEFMSGPTSYKWLHDSFGSNWRMPEMCSALVRVGLAKLPEWHAARTRNARRLSAALACLPALSVPMVAEDAAHAYYRLYAAVDTAALAEGWDRDRIARAIAAEGVPVQYGVCAELYREGAFFAAGIAPSDPLPGAAHAHATSLAFYVHPTLSESDIDDTAAAVRSVFEAATR